ncbi:MAG: hypothetical protein QXG39_02090 [Candidatus Aenigmatarchaeota archaeon]
MRSSSSVEKLIQEIFRERFVDNSTLRDLREEINELIADRLKILKNQFGNISGEDEAAIAFLQGLKRLGCKADKIDRILNKYTDFGFFFQNGELYIQISKSSLESESFRPLNFDNEFVKKCIEDAKYVHKLDELFEYIEKFLSEMIKRSNQIKDEIMQELKNTRIFKVVASKRMIDKLNKEAG